MSSSRVEKLLFALVVGVVYCYNFVNLVEGRACYRLLAFYLLCLSENVAMMLSWFFVHSADSPMSMRITVVCTSLGIFLLGKYVSKTNASSQFSFCSVERSASYSDQS